MAAVNCWRCLSRPSATIPTPARLLVPSAIGAAPFSNSATVNSQPPSSHVRAGKRMQLAKFKKKKVERGRPILPGERKAFRKRILLSNNNALEVPGLDQATAANLVDDASAGRVLGLPGDVVDKLRLVEAFKPTQCWSFFRSPHMLVRAETLQLAKEIHDAVSQKETLRTVITGDKASGKSMLLLQALTQGFLNDWIVINIPDAQALTTACTEYAPIPNTEPVQYSQPVYTYNLLQAILKSNEQHLTNMHVQKFHPSLSNAVPQGSSLAQLIQSAKEPDQAWAVFQALWAELTLPEADRPPVILGLDGMGYLMRVSDYRSPAFERIHSHDLALVRLFVSLLDGTARLPNGGAVVAATNASNTPRLPTMELALAQRVALQAGRADPPLVDPFLKGYDARVHAALKDVRVLPVAGVSKPEARALMEYWAASGVLRLTVDEATVAEKWALGGNGILGEMERASMLTLRI